MDELSKFKPQVFTPKKVDENGFDEDGVLHDKCGTDECCQKCDPEESESLSETVYSNKD